MTAHLLALALSIVTAQQAVTPSDSARASRRLWSLMRGLEAAESRYLAASPRRIDSVAARKLEPLAVERDFARAAATRLLDSVAFQTSWGYGEVKSLLAAYPASGLLLRTTIRLSARDGRDKEVIALSEKMLHVEPRDAELQISRARALERAGRSVAAKEGWTRAFELAPEDSTAFRALVRLHQTAGTLEDLLDRVGRLSMRRPNSFVLAEERIELLQRLGRTADAMAAVKALQALKEKP